MSLSPLLKFNLRYYRRHALLAILCLLGISLGVGIVVAVELINNSALSSLGSLVDFLSGKATHSLVSKYSRIDDGNFALVWKHPSVVAATPVVEVMSTTLETGKEPVRFIGLDPLLDAEFRNLAPRGRSEAGLTKFLTSPEPLVYLSGKLMQRHGLKAGDSLTVLVAGIEKRLRIPGALAGSEKLNVGDNLAIMDIAAAQEVFGRVGYLDRIDLIVSGSLEDLKGDLPSNLMITDRGGRKSTLQALLYSFQLNLAAMSLLALFVGVFLIYNFSMFSVLSRREDMSLLLTLGADRRGIVLAFIFESLLLGAIGSLIGIGFGYLIAWLSIERISSAISDIYFFLNVETVELTWSVVAIGMAVGFVATLIGTGLPALEVAVTPPIVGMKRRSIEDRAQALKGFLLAIGVACLLGSAVAAWASRVSIFWGFASAFGVTLAFALFTPSVLAPMTRHLGRFLKRGLGSLEGFLASGTIRASLSRTSIAVAALAVALSMTIGVDTMIHSFRESVRDWLSGTLRGDLYISPSTTKWDHPLPESLIARLQNNPDIAGVERYSTHEIYLKGKPVRLRVVDAAVLKDFSAFKFLKGEQGAWERMMKGGVFVSESLAYRFGLNVGDRIEPATPEGDRSFPIVAVVRDYSSDQGIIQIDRLVYENIWKDKRVQSVALFLKPGRSPEEIRKEIVKGMPGLTRTVVSNAEMKEKIFTIFDQTFAPTATLKGVSLLVALLGVATALTAILIERSREMTVLSYLGFTQRQLGTMNVYQAVIMGLMAFLIAVVCGPLLTYVIVHAINYRSFGWSIDISIQPMVFLKTLLLTLIACLASSFYPTYKLLKTPTATLEEE
jgi:putative ABC transport system permease protein